MFSRKSAWIASLVLVLALLGTLAVYGSSSHAKACAEIEADVFASVRPVLQQPPPQPGPEGKIRLYTALTSAWSKIAPRSIDVMGFRGSARIPPILAWTGTDRVELDAEECQELENAIIARLEVESGQSFGSDLAAWEQWAEEQASVEGLDVGSDPW